MSVVAPIAAVGVVVPLAWGVFSGEQPSLVQCAGILLAVGGVVLANGSERGGGSGRRAAALAVIAAVAFGSHQVLLARAGKTEVLGSVLVMKLAVVVTLLALGRVVRGTAKGWPVATVGLLVVLGALDLGANVCFLVATRHGLVSVVAVLSSLYPVVTVVLARLVLAERLARLQQAGVAVALGGVVLMAAGGG
jgi:drug/metabolite transporter (DMT)-like permease